MCWVLPRTSLVSSGRVCKSGQQGQEVGCGREEKQEQERQGWCWQLLTAHSFQGCSEDNIGTDRPGGKTYEQTLQLSRTLQMRVDSF